MTPHSYAQLASRELGREVVPSARPVVCVQGLGFVGAAMAVAIASARTGDEPTFDVIAVDRDVMADRIDAINDGRFPHGSVDAKLGEAFERAHHAGNLVATSDAAAYGLAMVIVVDVGLDIAVVDGQPSVTWDGFRQAIRTLGEHLSPGCLVLIETTVPPGTTEHVVAPVLREALRARGLADDGFTLAHSYERVMPGEDYLDSIVNFYRVYAGYDDRGASACERFLSQVINVAEYPLRRLASPRASETAKVLENSFRAVNIAMMEEWGRFAEAAGIDLFEVLGAIRDRATHDNIRQPGFGVGGYCLTKDPLFAAYAARELFELEGHTFPFCREAVRTNESMPIVTVNAVERLLGTLEGKRVALFGVSYRQGVADTRSSPSEIFVREVRARGGVVLPHDPIVGHWSELDESVPSELPNPLGLDAVVFAVRHDGYVDLDVAAWLESSSAVVFDANDVLSAAQRDGLSAAGIRWASIGRGTP